MAGFPRHTLHRLQLFGTSCFGTWKTFHSEVSGKFTAQRSGNGTKERQARTMFCKANNKSATVGIAVSGFETICTEPINPQVFFVRYSMKYINSPSGNIASD
jgi:N-acetylmuramoyl-L-alanine amidase CwlA